MCAAPGDLIMESPGGGLDSVRCVRCRVDLAACALRHHLGDPGG
jgi:hypothetical protein